MDSANTVGFALAEQMYATENEPSLSHIRALLVKEILYERSATAVCSQAIVAIITPASE
jgi:hypothetical protein